ncbi:secreted protein, putative [Ixodes scapularis]|uniref:Nuclear envelope membrane protein n=1 Tax=Ixodes scapularis TaxID=6945 RepID=B7QNJ0_IXOSC|nr:secreted protein, putative [Ixodes scapularis]|eukprot:XP_002416495.1 secreted protein, putative [Ixodes scapularis]
MKFQQLATLATSGAVVVFAVYTVKLLIAFLSDLERDRERRISATPNGLLWDVGLIAQFVVQHSLLCRSGQLERCFGVLSRSIYVFTSCISLVVLMYFWVPAASESALWSWNITDSLLLSWGFTALHYVCWALILGGCYILDIGELVGLKQVWYGLKGYGSPLQEKAWQFVRCLGHMRHPGLTALAAILWMRPTMPLDRAVLALCFTVYTYVAHDVDVLDFEYARRLCEQKARSPRSEGSHARR